MLRWFKGVGDYVATGEVVAEVETDKADMELEASDAGTVAEIRVKEGESAVVGTVIAVLRDGGEARPPATHEAQQPAAPSEKAEPHSAAGVPPPPPKATAVGAPPRTQPQPLPGPPPKRREARTPGTTEAVPHGRHALPKLRLAVAKQMTTSKREAPHFYVTGEFNMSAVADLRASLAASPTIPERITFTHFIIRAVTLTLLRHPRLNASWSEDSISYHEDINIGVAVALEDGLVAPVLRDCQN
ncbi:MAG: 2-oxo acid dehydrogenase subunit E2, partial [Candidatus Binatia bacterium]